jgi:hypothetical protein
MNYKQTHHALPPPSRSPAIFKEDFCVICSVCDSFSSGPILTYSGRMKLCSPYATAPCICYKSSHTLWTLFRKQLCGVIVLSLGSFLICDVTLGVSSSLVGPQFSSMQSNKYVLTRIEWFLWMRLFYWKFIFLNPPQQSLEVDTFFSLKFQKMKQR